MLHSTPLAVSLKPTSVESVPARLSFDHSQCSLPPLDLGEEDARSLPSVGTPIQAATPSVAGPIPLLSTSASTLNLTADHTKIIFNLACEGLYLKEWVTREFIRLSSEEVLFHTQAQSTSHESWPACIPTVFLPYTKHYSPTRSLRMPATRPWRKLLTRQIRHGHGQTRPYSTMFLTMRES